MKYRYEFIGNLGDNLVPFEIEIENDSDIFPEAQVGDYLKPFRLYFDDSEDSEHYLMTKVQLIGKEVL